MTLVKTQTSADHGTKNLSRTDLFVFRLESVVLCSKSPSCPLESDPLLWPAANCLWVPVTNVLNVPWTIYPPLLDRPANGRPQVSSNIPAQQALCFVAITKNLGQSQTTEKYGCARTVCICIKQLSPVSRPIHNPCDFAPG